MTVRMGEEVDAPPLVMCFFEHSGRDVCAAHAAACS